MLFWNSISTYNIDCCCSVAKSCCWNLCNPMVCSTPGSPVLHYLPEFAQIHVYWIDDVIQLSHPLLPFSFCLQSFPASGSFPRSQFFASGGQSIGASASVLPISIQGWFHLGLTGFDLHLLVVQGTLKSLLQHHNLKTSILWCSVFFTVQLSHPYMTTGKTIALTIWTFAGKVISLLFHMLCRFEGNGNPLQYSCLENSVDRKAWWGYSPWGHKESDTTEWLTLRFVTAFLPRSKCLLIPWQCSPSAVILGSKKIKSVSIFSPSIYHELMRPDETMILAFWMLSFKPAFTLSSFTLIKRLFSFSLLSAISVVSSHIWGCFYFSQQSWFQIVLHPAWHFTWCALHRS